MWLVAIFQMDMDLDFYLELLSGKFGKIED